MFDYVKHALEKVKKGKSVYKIELIGDAKFFEGLILCKEIFDEYFI